MYLLFQRLKGCRPLFLPSRHGTSRRRPNRHRRRTRARLCASAGAGSVFWGLYVDAYVKIMTLKHRQRNLAQENGTHRHLPLERLRLDGRAGGAVLDHAQRLELGDVLRLFLTKFVYIVIIVWVHVWD